MNYDEQLLFQEYQKKKDVFATLKNSAIADFSSLLEKNNISVNKVVGRIKSFDSFFQKIQTMAQSDIFFENPCDDINDLVGVRIVLLFVDDLDKIESILKPTFIIKNKKRYSEGFSDNQFGYESDHYILTYGQVDGPHYNEVKNIKFELQVRTVLMDAWDSVSHELDYKSDASIPSDLKRVFYGLSGLFVVADQQFQQIKKSIKSNKSKQEETSKDPLKLLSQEINLDTLKAYSKYKFKNRFIKKDELYSNFDKKYSEFAEELKNFCKYTSISDIDKVVDSHISEVYKNEKIDYKKVFFTAIGLIRMSIKMENKEYSLFLINKLKTREKIF